MVSMGKDLASSFELESLLLLREFPMKDSLVLAIKKNVIKFLEPMCEHNRMRNKWLTSIFRLYGDESI